MPVLTPLDPPQGVRSGQYEFIALSAGRTPDGLAASVQVNNGAVCWAGTVVLADELARLAAATRVADASSLSRADADHAFLQLAPKVEERYRLNGAPIEWPDPIPLSSSAPPSFPIQCLPDWLAAMVTGTADRLQVPVDLPAMLSLAVIGTALAKKVNVRVRQNYYVPLNCYVMCGMESGERKSPTYRAMLKPVVDHEWERIEKVEKENKERERTKEEPLPLPQLFVDDITTEQIPIKLKENGERLAVFSDEGDSLDIMAGRYSKGSPNFGIYLKGWDGGIFKVDRGSRPSLYLRHPLLTIGLCVQPSVLQGLAETPSFRDRGLLGRFWFCLPTSFMGWRKAEGSPIAQSVEQTYSDRMRALLGMPLPDQRPAAIDLSHAAYKMLMKFSTDLEPLLRPDGELRPIKDWVAKLEGSIARLSGQLHMAYGFRSDTPISIQTMEKAILLGRYLLEQAKCSFGLMRGDPHMPNATLILRWIERRGLTEFSRRDVYRDNPSHFEHPDDCMPALFLLAERSIIAQRAPPPRSGPGRPGTPMYDVNPAVVEKHSQNRQNSDAPEETGESEDTTEYESNSIITDDIPFPDNDDPPPVEPEWYDGQPF